MTLKIYITLMADKFRNSFLRREDGSVAIETMIMLPILFWSYLCLYSIYDSFRTISIHQKASYTISDAVSRETMPIDAQYLTGIRDLFEYLSESEGGSKMRVSQLWFDDTAKEYKTDWSQVRGSVSPLSDNMVRDWNTVLPAIPDLERVVVVETWYTFKPPFDIGLIDNDIKTFTFTRPRYAPRVCFEECPAL